MKLRDRQAGERAALSADLAVAIAIMAIALLPIAVSFSQEQRVLAGHYRQALAAELIDGELEMLAAGEWRNHAAGARPYTVKAAAARNLPPGTFTLTIHGKKLRLAWEPASRGQGGRVEREVQLP